MNKAKGDLVLFKATSGALSALVRQQDGHSVLLHSAVDPELEAKDLPIPEIWGNVILCLGIGLGYHLKALASVKKPLLILLCEQWQELLNEVSAIFEGSPHRVIPIALSEGMEFPALPPAQMVQVIRHPASYRMASALFEEFAEIFLSTIRTEMIHHSISNKAPRVLMLHGTHFLQEELRNALKEVGAPFLLQSYELEQKNGSWESTVLRVLQEFRPNLILSINMKGVDTGGILLDCARRLGIPLHCWFVDDPRPISLAYDAKNYPWIQAWCWEKAYLPWLKQKGFNNPRWLPLAGDPTLFPKRDVTPSLELVFTGSAMGQEYLQKIRQSFLFDLRLNSLVEVRSEALLVDSQVHSHLLDGFPLPFQDERNRNWLECLIQHTASFKKRQRLLLPLVDQGLLCAGDPKGWRESLGAKVQTIADIPYRTELAGHYQRCVVNLNITSCQMPSAVNQRLFDVPLCGGFLLTDMQSDVYELFHPSEVATYENVADLTEKVQWFKGHVAERNRIATAARSRILDEHTYAKRIQEIFRLRND